MPHCTGSPGLSPGMPTSLTTSRLNARYVPVELKKRLYPKRASLTIFEEKVRVFDPMYCSKLVMVLLPSRVRPVLDWFSSPQLYRPDHCDLADSTKSMREMNWS